MRFSRFPAFFSILLSVGAAASPKPAASRSPVPLPAPAIASLLKKETLKRVLEDREVMTHAELTSEDDARDPDLKRYQYYAAMSVNASPTQTRRVLTQYDLYEKMIPYVSKSRYVAQDHALLLEGGIWNFKMGSLLKIEERGEGAIGFRIVEGHFTGMTGDILFEPSGERSTLVLLRGESHGRRWPPRLILERGAEIVFGYTGRRMRSFIEAEKDSPIPTPAGGSSNDHEVPQPRNSRAPHR